MSRIGLTAAVVFAAVVPVLGAPSTTSRPAGTVIPKIAVFQLRDEIVEKPPEVSFGLSMEQEGTLYDLVQRLTKARKDERVKAVVVTFEEPLMGWGQLQELRGALAALRRANKDVYCYLEEVSGGIYQLAAAGSRLCIAPSGQVDLKGLYLESPYFKGLLDKIHLEADIEHIGAYKSAGEPFTRTGPSEEARAMLEWISRDLFDQMVGAIADGRRMTPEKVRSLIDEGPFDAKQALEVGLVDEILDADAFLDTLYERYTEDAEVARDYGVEEGPQVDFSSPFAFFKLLGESISKKKAKAKSAVAVVYIDGMIVTGQTEPGLFGYASEVGSTTMRRTLARLREDDSIKAVVIRVDSPGGSATASDIIWRAVCDLADAKPTVVSMGNVAASGGYYVSAGVPTIFADPATITGSIGVIGGKLVTKGLWDWLGVSFDEVAIGRNADLYNTNRRFDDRQREIIRGQLQRVYELFSDRVKKGRESKLAKHFEEIAGGRVYTGKQAKELGLVDELGGLDDAIAYVAGKAEIKDYEVRQYPEPHNFMDLFLEELTGRRSPEEEGGGISLGVTGRSYGQSGEAAKWLFCQPMVRQFVEALRQADPAGARTAVRGLFRLDLLRRYGALAVMPIEILIR